MYNKSESLFSRAQQSIPGGVNSPVRAFKGVGGTPLFISKAKGAYLYDADGNGAGTAAQIATIGVGLNMTSADIVVI